MLCFTFQFLSLESYTGMTLKVMKLLSQHDHHIIKEFEHFISVHAQLCHGMPACTCIEQSQDSCVVWLWEESIKCWDGALIMWVCVMESGKKSIKPHLKNILKVVRSHLLHFRYIRIELSNGVVAKGGSESVT
jgi:hypothetical protein